jgi:YggT family protein
MEGASIVLDPLIGVILIALRLYMWAVIISVVLSWLVHFGVVNTRNQYVAMIGHFLWRLTEPALRPIRRILPNLGGIDISPIVLFLVIIFVQDVLVRIRYAI